MNARILNRTNTIPSDGWFHIEVTGTHPAGDKRQQLIDEKAINSIKNRFDAEKAEAGEDFAGMLVDLDHLSHNLDQSTEAYGWLQEVEIRNHAGKPQLFGRIDLTDLGETAIRNKRVKWFSTEYDPEDIEPAGDGVVRPLRLAGLAFTNRPNNRGGKPISNRADQPGGEPKQKNENRPTMQPIAEALGLSADADQAAILDAITKLKSKAQTLETKDNEAEAEKILNTIGKNIPKEARDHWKQELIKNRESATKSIELSFPLNPKREDNGRIINREKLSSPPPVEAQEDKDADAAANKKASAIRNRAHSIANERNISFGRAFDLAQAELS